MTTNKNIEKKKSALKIVALLLAVTVLLSAVATGVYFLFFRDSLPNNPNNNLSENPTSQFGTLVGKFTDREIKDEESAILAVQDVADYLGLKNAAAELTPKTTNTVDNLTYYRLQQNYKGIPVYGSTFVVISDENGEAQGLTGNAEDISFDISLTPIVTKEEVEASIQAYVGEDIEISVPDLSVDMLVIYNYDDVEKATLAYEMYAFVQNKPYKALISATNASVIKAFSLDMTETVQATAIDHTKKQHKDFNVSTKVENGENVYYLIDEKRNILIYDAHNGTVTYEIYDKNGRLLLNREGNDVVENWWNGDVSSFEVRYYSSSPSGITTPVCNDNKWTDAPKGVALINQLQTVYDFWSDEFQINGIDNNTPNCQIVGCFNDNSDLGNAYCWGYAALPLDTTLFSFGTDHDISLDSVAHEYMHAIEKRISLMDYQGESGAIMEGYSDVFGELVEGWKYGYYDWEHGNRDMKKPNTHTAYFCQFERTNTPCPIWLAQVGGMVTGGTPIHTSWCKDYFVYPSVYYGDGFVDPKSNYDNGGVHHNSTVISHAAYLMYNGVNDKYQKLTADDIANLWFHALQTLPSDCSFFDLRGSLEMAATLTLSSIAKRECVTAALVEVGINKITCSPDFSISVYDSKGNIYSDYTVKVNGPRLNNHTLTPEHEVINWNSKWIGEYKITIQDNNNKNNFVIRTIIVEKESKNDFNDGALSIQLPNNKSFTEELIEKHLVNQKVPSDFSNTLATGFAPGGVDAKLISSIALLLSKNNSLIDAVLPADLLSAVLNLANLSVDFPDELVLINEGINDSGLIWKKYHFTYLYGSLNETMYLLHVQEHEHEEGTLYLMFAKAGAAVSDGKHDEVYRKVSLKSSLFGEYYFHCISGAAPAVALNAAGSSGEKCVLSIENDPEQFLYWDASQNNILTSTEWKKIIHFEERFRANDDTSLPLSAADAVKAGFEKMPDRDSKYHQANSALKEYQKGYCVKYCHKDGREAIYEIILDSQSQSGIESNANATKLITLSNNSQIGPTYNYSPNDFDEDFIEGLWLKLTHNSIAHYYFDMLPYYWWGNAPDGYGHTHTFGDWTVTKQPTETTKGEKTRTCSSCGEKELEEIPMLSHTHSYTITTQAATCTVAGWKKQTCSCGDVITETLEVIAHNYVNGKCSVCGAWPEAVTFVEYGNHKYVLYDISLTWHEAKSFCETLGGHLVTITSAEEQTIIEQLIENGSKKQYWLGMDTFDGRWITGESIVYTKWDEAQPDKLDREDGEYERYVQIYNEKNPAELLVNSQKYHWNDVFYDNTRKGEENFFSPEYVGFICEFEPQCGIPTITTPNGVEVEQGNGLTLTWTPPQNPSNGVEYFLAVMEAGKESETYTNVTTEWISKTSCEINSKYFIHAGTYVVTLYARSDGYLQSQTSINVIVDNSYFGFNFKEDYPIDILVDRDDLAVAPYAYVDTSLFANKKIIKIDVPVGSVSAVDENQYFTLWVVKSALIKQGANVTDAFYKQYKIYIPIDEITSTVVNKWISIDVSALNIYVGSDETLAFMKSDDPVICCFKMEPDYAFGYDLANKAILQSTHSIYYGVKTESWNGEGREEIPQSNPNASKGLSFKSNKDGTCYVAGIGACTDRDIVIPEYAPNGDKVIGIGNDAFDWEDITSVVIPEGVRYIGQNAFYYCSSLTKITIPSTITECRGTNIFSWCSKLSEVHITDLYAWCQLSFEHDSSNPLSNQAYLYLNGVLIEQLVIPDGVKKINDFAFSNCKGIKSIIVSDSVQSIGDYAFYNCKQEYIYIPTTLEHIGSYAFVGSTHAGRIINIYYQGTEAEWKARKFSFWGNEVLYYQSEKPSAMNG